MAFEISNRTFITEACIQASDALMLMRKMSPKFKSLIRKSVDPFTYLLLPIF